MDLTVALAGLIVGIVVGLTGMGGGALMTPILVLVFHVTPLAAVSSDLVAAAVMKPVGGFVHARRGTVHWPLVCWLTLGSAPSAFIGVLLLRALGHGEQVQQVVQYALGTALVLAAAGLAARPLLRRFRRHDRDDAASGPVIALRRLPTLAVGAAGGLVVGMTSVGSGSLMIVALMALYPGLSVRRLIGTDLVQAVPLVAAAAAGHLLFGDFRAGLTLSLLVGAVPGAWIGSRLSSRAPEHLVRRGIAVVLVLSGVKLFGAGPAVLGGCLLALLAAAALGSRRAPAPPSPA